VGEKEINERRVKPRIRKDLAVLAVHPDLDIDDFLKTVANETKSRVSKTSL
jgi:hypothetical protein